MSSQHSAKYDFIWFAILWRIDNNFIIHLTVFLNESFDLWFYCQTSEDIVRINFQPFASPSMVTSADSKPANNRGVLTFVFTPRFLFFVVDVKCIWVTCFIHKPFIKISILKQNRNLRFFEDSAKNDFFFFVCYADATHHKLNSA